MRNKFNILFMLLHNYLSIYCYALQLVNVLELQNETNFSGCELNRFQVNEYPGVFRYL
jgi:hypothetical protein